MKFCPQCGASLIEGDLFCQQCGYKIEKEVDISSEKQSPEIPQNESYKPYNEPVPPSEDQYQNSGIGYPPPFQSNGFSNAETKKGKLIPILVIGIALILLATGCWLVYTKFFKEKAIASTSDTTNIVSTPSTTAVSDSTAKVNDIQPEQISGSAIDNSSLKETSPAKEKVVTTTSPKTTKVVKTEDQTMPVQETKPTTVNTPNTQPSTEIADEPPSKMIFKIGQLGITILKNPEKDCDFRLNGRYCITRITTDHYNSGRGSSYVGTIGIEDLSTSRIKKWHARGLSRNSKWIIEPRVILEPGTYVIHDSDRESWTKNFSGKGFVTIEGYKVQ